MYLKTAFNYLFLALIYSLNHPGMETDDDTQRCVLSLIVKLNKMYNKTINLL